MVNTIIISIEGVIGVGKSHIIDYIKSNLEYVDGYPIVYLQEPVNVWMSVTDKDGASILEKFYDDQSRYAFTFQMLAMISIAKQLREAIDDNPGTVIIMERSVHSCRSVFVRSLHEGGMITDMEKIIYDMTYDEINGTLNRIPLTKNGIIYLKTPIKTCMNRVKSRNRIGEACIEMNYLERCEEYHNEFFKGSSFPKRLCESNDIVCGKTVISAIRNIIEDISSERSFGTVYDCIE